MCPSNRNRLLAAASGLAGLADAFTNTKVDFFMRKNIDPIVIPGQYKSHMHSFFGSDAVNVNLSTTADLQTGCATAQNPNDMSIYWIPTLYHVEGNKRTPIEPVAFMAYYYFDKDPAEVAIPPNFNVVAGNAQTKSESDLIEGLRRGKAHSQFPQSTCSTSLQAVLWFPDCVDSATLKSAYSNKGACSDGMKRMPQLRFSIRYDTKKAVPNGWSGEPPLELACGASHCFHGNFINGWLEEAAETMVTALTSKWDWQAVDGPNGKDKATDADPDNGTSDYAESLKMMSAWQKRRRAPRRRMAM